MSANEAKWIWTDPDGIGRNRYALFRFAFELADEPAGGTLHLFADTRYRLLVNGRVAGHGPARFFAAAPEYDTYDLAPLLRRGRNALAVVVNSYGTTCFHAEASVGGLIAWGHAKDRAGHTAAIATDETWRAIDCPAHRPDTPALSFALNPGELLDARRLEADWADADFDDDHWPHAAVHAHPEHWGELRPRSIPPLDESEMRPQRCLGAWSAAGGEEDVYSLIVTLGSEPSPHLDARVAVMTYLHSPREQGVPLGAWWGRYWLNGQPLEGVVREEIALRQDFVAELQEGWNTLFVYETIRHDWWDFHLAVPRSADVAVSADRHVDSPNTFLVAGPWKGSHAEAADALELPLGHPTHLPQALGAWQPWPRERSAETPCRERAWKTFERIADDLPLPVDVSAVAGACGDATLSLLFDFGAEVLGRPTVDFSAAEGTRVDLTYTERLRADGTADVHRRYFVDMAERTIAREGRQQWQTFHPRGFRYLELLVTGELADFELHDVAVTRANYPVERIGRFECSDAVLNAVWAMGPPTLEACMEDAYLDCPWRERGLYSGDFLVEFFGNLAAFGDTKLFRRCIDLFFQAQGDSGLVPPCPHGLPPGKHPDYSAILVQAVWQYYARTGDASLLRERADGLNRLLDALEALVDERMGLVDGSDLSPYVDRSRTDREGMNCALNCFCLRGWQDGARVFAVLGEADRAAALRARSDELAENIRKRFWDDRVGAFADRPRSALPRSKPSVPANALALLYDVADEGQAARAVEWLVEAMQNNFRTPQPAELRDCNVSTYFSFYALGALYKYARAEQAEQFMRTYWGRMIECGAWTCWEHMLDVGSRCHAWSTAPTHFLSERVLGVTPGRAGEPNLVRIRPHPGSLEWARGVWPHPAGPVRVSWQVRDGRVEVDYDAPEGVEVVVETDPAPPGSPEGEGAADRTA